MHIGIQSDMEESATTLLVTLGSSPNNAQTRPRLATPELSREEWLPGWPMEVHRRWMIFNKDRQTEGG